MHPGFWKLILTNYRRFFSRNPGPGTCPGRTLRNTRLQKTFPGLVPPGFAEALRNAESELLRGRHVQLARQRVAAKIDGRDELSGRSRMFAGYAGGAALCAACAGLAWEAVYQWPAQTPAPPVVVALEPSSPLVAAGPASSSSLLHAASSPPPSPRMATLRMNCRRDGSSSLSCYSMGIPLHVAVIRPMFSKS